MKESGKSRKKLFSNMKELGNSLTSKYRIANCNHMLQKILDHKINSSMRKNLWKKSKIGKLKDMIGKKG